MRRKFNKKESLPVTLIQGKPFLYADWRVDRNTVPKEAYLYEIADADCDGTFCRIQTGVLVNFVGTLIGKCALDLEDGMYFPKYGSLEYEGTFYDSLSFEEYIASETVYEEDTVKDGEILCREGHQYATTVHGELEGVDTSDMQSLYEEAAAYGFTPDSISADTEKGAISFVFTPTSDVRTAEISCSLLDIVDELGVRNYNDLLEFYVISEEEDEKNEDE